MQKRKGRNCQIRWKKENNSDVDSLNMKTDMNINTKLLKTN